MTVKSSLGVARATALHLLQGRLRPPKSLPQLTTLWGRVLLDASNSRSKVPRIPVKAKVRAFQCNRLLTSTDNCVLGTETVTTSLPGTLRRSKRIREAGFTSNEGLVQEPPNKMAKTDNQGEAPKPSAENLKTGGTGPVPRATVPKTKAKGRRGKSTAQ